MKKILKFLMIMAIVMPMFSCDSDKEDIPTEIKLSKTKADLKVAATIKLTASLLPGGAKGDILWTSSDDKIATVADGLVTAVSAGEVKITATYENLKSVCTIKITIVEILVTKITLDKPNIIIYNGDEQTLGVTLTPEDNTQDTIWSSSNEEIVTIDNSGKIKAISVGEAVITAKAGSVSTDCKIKVIKSYILPDYSWASYISLEKIVFGNVTIEGITADFTTYPLISKISKSEPTEFVVVADQARTGADDPTVIEVFIDWNGDGDFSDDGEELMRITCLAKDAGRHVVSVTPPANAVSAAGIRVLVYYAKGSTKMNKGFGIMDSGQGAQLSYELID